MLRDMALDMVTGERIVNEAKKQLIGIGGQVIDRIPSLSEATMKWLDQYQKGRFEITVDTSQLSKEVGKLTRLGREIVIAIMLVGIIIGSAVGSYGIAAAGPQGQIWDILSRLVPLMLILALLIAFLIVLRLIWRWFRGQTPEGD